VDGVRWTVAAVGVVVVRSSCGDDTDLPPGPVLSVDECSQLQDEFDATDDLDTDRLSALNEQMARGGCYANTEDRARMLERELSD
jgi:hypothetical protein